MNLKEMGHKDMDWRLEYGLVAGCCEHGNEFSGSILLRSSATVIYSRKTLFNEVNYLDTEGCTAL
jgi:hypothetical protein